jgi:hypothetical protein
MLRRMAVLSSTLSTPLSPCLARPVYKMCVTARHSRSARAVSGIEQVCPDEREPALSGGRIAANADHGPVRGSEQLHQPLRGRASGAGDKSSLGHSSGLWCGLAGDGSLMARRPHAVATRAGSRAGIDESPATPLTIMRRISSWLVSVTRRDPTSLPVFSTVMRSQFSNT